MGRSTLGAGFGGNGDAGASGGRIGWTGADGWGGWSAPAQAKAAADSRPRPVVTTEDLGTDVVQGIPVTVTKTTTVVPAGRAGNDAPITKTQEVWTSQDMKLLMKEQWEDPRTGERTVELDKFSRAEPDPALFRAPSGYTVKDIRETLKELEERLNEMQN